MKKNHSKQLGFSFAEAIFVVAALIIILVTLLLIYNNYTKIFGYQQALISTADSARITMNELQKFTQQSDKILSSHSFSGITRSSSQNTLVLEVPSIDNSGNILNGKYDFVAFYTSGTILNELTQADTSSNRPSGVKELSNTVSSLEFTYNNANPELATEVDVDLETQATSRQQTAAYNLYQKIYLRNK
jgi:hypothetical protein